MSISILQPRAKIGSEIVDQFGSTVFFFDATTSEDHEHNASVSRHPIEEGVDVADHIRIEPLLVKLEGVVTNTPLDSISIIRQNTGIARANRVQDKYAALVEFFLQKRMVTVITGLQIYNDMVIERIHVPRGKPRQDIRPTIEFVEARFATAVTVPIPPNILAATKKKKGQDDSELGNQSAKDADEKKKERFNLSTDSFFKNMKEGRSLLGLGGLGL